LVANAAKDIKSLKSFFYPESVAIIGASGDPKKPGGQPLVALQNSGYQGKLFPVNPQYQELFGVKCYPSIKAIPEEVDLAIIAVPATIALATLQECAEKKVKAVIIITSGFAELNKEGAIIQKKMAELANQHGMRICGPNSMGIISSPARLMANFFIMNFPDKESIPTRLGFISQSGGFGSGIYEMIRSYGMGISHFISSGNEADVDFSDYLAYMAHDPCTQIIGGYMEGIRNGANFIKAAEAALAGGKPVLLVKTGKSTAGAKAAASHTGALTGSDRVYNAVFRQKGITRVESLHEMLTLLTVLSGGRLPRGNRVGLISSSGGAGVFLTDKFTESGFVLPQFTGETREKLAQLLPSFATPSNPLDITSAVMADPTLFLNASELVAEDPNIDIMAICQGTSKESLKDLLQQGFPDMIAGFAEKIDKPVVVFFWGHQNTGQFIARSLTERKVPSVYEMEYGVKALASLLKYNSKRTSFLATRKPISTVSGAKEETARILKDYPAGARLTEYESKKILTAYGIPATRGKLATSAGAAAEAAQKIGFPVVLKVESPDILHKTDSGGVKLNLQTPRDVENAYRDIMANIQRSSPQAKVKGVLVQEMLSQGVEVIVGIGQDEVFGSIVIFGLGGILVEALKDISLRVPPLIKEDALEMIAEIKGRRLLEGFRGLLPVDKEALAEIILQVSRLALDFPEIAELDINPMICTRQGIKAADALIILRG